MSISKGRKASSTRGFKFRRGTGTCSGCGTYSPCSHAVHWLAGMVAGLTLFKSMGSNFLGHMLWHFSHMPQEPCLHQFSIIFPLSSDGRGRSVSLGATCPTSPQASATAAFSAASASSPARASILSGKKNFLRATRWSLRTKASYSTFSFSLSPLPTDCLFCRCRYHASLGSAFLRYSFVTASPRNCCTRSRAASKTERLAVQNFFKLEVICRFPLVVQAKDGALG